jgi:hypothetical protein
MMLPEQQSTSHHSAMNAMAPVFIPRDPLLSSTTMTFPSQVAIPTSSSSMELPYSSIPQGYVPYLAFLPEMPILFPETTTTLKEKEPVLLPTLTTSSRIDDVRSTTTTHSHPVSSFQDVASKNEPRRLGERPLSPSESRRIVITTTATTQ